MPRKPHSRNHAPGSHKELEIKLSVLGLHELMRLVGNAPVRIRANRVSFELMDPETFLVYVREESARDAMAVMQAKYGDLKGGWHTDDARLVRSELDRALSAQDAPGSPGGTSDA